MEEFIMRYSNGRNIILFLILIVIILGLLSIPRVWAQNEEYSHVDFSQSVMLTYILSYASCEAITSWNSNLGEAFRDRVTCVVNQQIVACSNVVSSFAYDYGWSKDFQLIQLSACLSTLVNSFPPEVLEANPFFAENAIIPNA